MEPFGSHRGSQTAIFLAGCILSCFLQLAPAQENLTVVSEPKHIIVGQSVLLNVKNVPRAVARCEWTQPNENKIGFSPETKFSPTIRPQTIELHENCSLTIKALKSSDAGTYTIQITVRPEKQEGETGRTNEKIYIGSAHLTFCDKISITVKPANRHPGQNVTLVPEGMSDSLHFCEWSQKTKSGVEEEFHDSREDSRKRQNQPQKIVAVGCSLHLIHLNSDHNGNYTVFAEDQEHTKKKGAEDQLRCYTGRVEMLVPKAGSASLKYSTGILAGTLLGSLTWTCSLSLLPLLFGMVSPFFREC